MHVERERRARIPSAAANRERRGAGGAGAEPTRPLYTKWWFWLAATFAVVALVVIAQLLINGKGGGSSAEGEPGGPS